MSWLGKINGLFVGPSFCLSGHRQPGARPSHRLGLARHGSLIAPPPHPSRSWPRWPWSPRRLTKVSWATARTILGRDGIGNLNELKVRFGEQLRGEIKLASLGVGPPAGYVSKVITHLYRTFFFSQLQWYIVYYNNDTQLFCSRLITLLPPSFPESFTLISPAMCES